MKQKKPSKKVSKLLEAAVLHHKANELDAALTQYKKILRLAPNHPDALHLIGVIHNQRHQYEEGAKSIEKAILFKPDVAMFYSNLGNAYQGMGQVTDARNSFQKALALDSDNLDAKNNLGWLLFTQEEYLQAKILLEEVVQKNPTFIQALCTLGRIYQLENNKAQAEIYIEKAYEVNPNHLDVLCLYVPLLLERLDWDAFEVEKQKLLQQLELAVESPQEIMLPHYYQLHIIDNLTLNQKLLHKITQSSSYKENIKYTHSKHTKSKLKIAYLSPDFNTHTVGLLLNNTLKQHDRSKFEIIALNLSNEKDGFYQTIADSVDSLIDLSHLDTDESAKLIQSQEIDILVDLGGLTNRAKPQILAQKPAPIQCHYLGDYGSLGLPYIDYYLSTETEVPKTHAEFFVENIIYLNTPFAREPLAPPNTIASKSDFGFSEDSFVFCCFNKQERIDSQVFNAWLEILSQCPQSILWLHYETLSVKDKLHQAAKARGLDAQLYLTEKEALSERWCFNAADCYLDTFVLNALTSSFFAASHGLPVLTHLGTMPQARYGAALQYAQGLDELVAETVEEYIQKAVKLATDKSYYHTIKTQCAALTESSPLFQVENFVRELESAYTTAWQNYLEGKNEKFIEV